MKWRDHTKTLFGLLAIFVLFPACDEGGCGRLLSSNKGGVPVMVEHVKSKESSPVTSIVGTLRPNDRADISFPNEVRVQDVFVNVGNTVNKGDALLRLSEDDMNQSLNLARAKKVELEVLIDKNRNIMSGRERSVEEGKIADDEIKRMEKQIASDEASLDRVKAEIEKLTYNLENIIVPSPISGVVVSRNVNTGGVLKAAETLVTIVNVDPIVVSFDLNTKQASDIVVGSEMKVLVNDVPDKSFSAKVTYIGPELQRADNTFEVWATIPNSENILKSGMSATTEISSETSKKTVIIPLTAVQSIASKPFVFKVNKGIAYKTHVVIDAVRNGEVELVQGLGDEDMIVVKGAENLFDGAEVNIWR